MPKKNELKKSTSSLTKEILADLLGDLCDFFLAIPTITNYGTRVYMEREIPSDVWEKMLSDRKKQRVIRNLRRKKFLVAKKQGEHFLLTISTNAAVEALKTRIKQKNAFLKNGDLCMVVFDFPNGATSGRNRWRHLLLSCGFKKIQLSVYTIRKDVLFELVTLTDLLGAKKWIRIYRSSSQN